MQAIKWMKYQTAALSLFECLYSPAFPNEHFMITDLKLDIIHNVIWKWRH